MSLPRISKISLSLSNERNKKSKKNIINQKVSSAINRNINKTIKSRNHEINTNNHYLQTTNNNFNKNPFSLSQKQKEFKTISQVTQTQFEDFPEAKITIPKFSYSNSFHNGKKFIPKFLNKKNGNFLSNEFLKNHLFNYPSFHVNNNIITFKNKNLKHIVTDDVSLLGILQNQTNSNFNNKYNLKYWTNNKKKKEQNKQCYNLIKKGINLNDIDNLLNSQREIISYKIQTPKTKNIQNNSRITKIHERKNYNLTINTLENIRPLTTFNKRIISENFY